MLLECYDRDISYGILVNVQAGFEDVLMLGRFVEKLSSVAGYQQVRVDEGNFSAMMSGGLEHEDDTGEEDFDEYDTDEEDVDESKEFGSKSEAKMNVQRPRPILMFVEERGNPPANPIDFHFPAGGTYFEITDPRDNVCYRFAHTQPVNNRTYESFPRDFGTSGGRRHKYLLHNVMMQSPPNPINTHQQLYANLTSFGTVMVKVVNKGNYSTNGCSKTPHLIASRSLEEPSPAQIVNTDEVHRARNDEGLTVALKYEVPSCAWEAYISQAVHNRVSTEISLAIMKIDDMYIFRNASLIVNEYLSMGNMLQCINNVTGEPDNVMFIGKLPEGLSLRADVLLSARPIIRLIDWGRAIDLSSLPGGTSFSGRAGTQCFDCPEMLNDRPWTYQTDHFSFAASLHVGIFKTYGKVVEDSNGFMFEKPLPRRRPKAPYIRGVMSQMLSIPSCEAISS
ncbi:unnamed protein product, partial [Mesorhabditis belari]|uniref:Protein kinase domain-containing protein n=1 Tax=Mesorhabditis belari TaxID=2138241 RepID=A0AAF3JBH9_9BILA